MVTMISDVYWVLGCVCPRCMEGRRRVLEEVQATWGLREAEEKQVTFWTGDRLERLAKTEYALETE